MTELWLESEKAKLELAEYEKSNLQSRINVYEKELKPLSSSTKTPVDLVNFPKERKRSVANRTEQVETKGQILIVDNETSIRQMLKLYLNANFPEFSTVLVRDAQEAIDYINQHQPMLTILDEYVPKKDGYDALEAINKQNAGLSVILTTFRKISKSEIVKKYENIEWRNVDLFPKPFLLEDLDEIIERMKL